MAAAGTNHIHVTTQTSKSCFRVVERSVSMDRVDKEAFAAAIRTYRRAAGMTQKQLADASEVTPQAVSLWEGGSVPDLDKIATIEQVLDVPNHELRRLAGYLHDSTADRVAELEAAVTRLGEQLTQLERLAFERERKVDRLEVLIERLLDER